MSLCRSRVRERVQNNGRDHEHSINVFHRLMLRGKLRFAVRWITERDSSGLLSPMDMTKAKTTAGGTAEVSVLDALSIERFRAGHFTCKNTD